MKKLYSVRTIILAGSLLLQLGTFCFRTRGAAGDVDLSFDPGSGVNGTVSAVALQPDGMVIIGGSFTTVKGLARSKVARLNADGSGDSSFNAVTGTNAWGYLHAIALQADGKVLVGYEGGISRLNSDGSRDTNFNAGANGGVSSITLQPDGKVLVVLVGGGGVVRLNSNGSLDSSFNAEAGSFIYSMALQSDGKVIIDSYFDAGGGSYGLVRLNANGSVDSSFIGGVEDLAYSMTLQSDGKVVIGGFNGIARLNANGSLDNSFKPATNGAYGYVSTVALQPDGKVLVGGSFTTFNGTNRNGIARLNANGSLDSTFNPLVGPLYVGIYSIVLQSDGKVLIGGSFATVNGTNRNRIARLNADGSLDSSFNPGAGADWVSLIVLQPDGKALVGGLFTFINGTNRYARARLNTDGSSDGTFISSTNFNPDLAAFNDYYDYTGIYSYYQDNGATVVLAQANGKVLLGGYSYDAVWGGDENYPVNYEVSRYFIARFNADGSPDSSFEPATGNWNYYPSDFQTLRALAVQPDGKVFIGGNFSSVNGTNRNGIARLNANGSLDSSFNPNISGGSVSSVAGQSDGKVLIGGSFTGVNGTNRHGIARLNANGSLDSSFNPGTGVFGGAVSSIALQSDGKMLIGGNFTTVNGANRNRIARLNANGSLDSSFNPGAGADGSVLSIVLQPDGNVLIGGDFLTVNGVLLPFVARLYGDSVPSLNIARSNAFVIVSWPVTGLNFQLQENTNLALPNSWSPVAQAAVTNAGQISVTVPTTIGRKFFRLKSQ